MSPEFYSRAQAVHREQRDLYDYWLACAPPGGIPSCDVIDPVSVPRLLPRLSLIDAFDDLDRLRYRLAGTQVRELFSAEVKGQRVFEVGFQHKRSYWLEVFGKVIHGQLAMQGLVRGPLAGRDHLLLVWLRLPLAGSAGRVERILGYDAALALSARDLAQAADRLALPSARVASRR